MEPSLGDGGRGRCCGEEERKEMYICLEYLVYCSFGRVDLMDWAFSGGR